MVSMAHLNKVACIGRFVIYIAYANYYISSLWKIELL